MIGITNSIKKIGSESNVGVEEVKVRLQLYETCLVPSLIYALRWMGKYYRNRNGTIGENTSKPVKSIAEHGENNSIHWDLNGNRDMAYQRENRVPNNDVL